MENKENKRIIKWYYSNIILNILFLVIFIIISLYVIFPLYEDYKNNKNNLLVEINNYEKLQKYWLNFSDFLWLITDDNTKLFATKMWSEFFNNNLKNNSWKTYLDFLKEKEKIVNELKKSDKIKFRDEKISKILPSYQEWVIMNENMTDLEFINYIELLLRNFRLKSDSQIWINELVLVWNKNTKNNIDSLSSQIFYIPLKLEIEWAKGDIVDFLYFLQNVWKVWSIKDNDISFYKDNVLDKNLWRNNNIYENKIVDIESIELKDYIDTSSFIRSTYWEKSVLWFLNFIRNWVEKSQVYKLNISLRFYVKWLPTYKLELYISKTIDIYKQKLKLVTDNLKIAQAKKWIVKTTDIINIISNLKSIETYLIDMNKIIKELELWIKNKDNFDKLYINATKIRYDIDNIDLILNENIKKIKNLSGKK